MIILYRLPTDHVAARMCNVNFTVKPTYAHTIFDPERPIGMVTRVGRGVFQRADARSLSQGSRVTAPQIFGTYTRPHDKTQEPNLAGVIKLDEKIGQPVVRHKVGRPPGELGVSKSMECDIFPSVL